MLPPMLSQNFSREEALDSGVAKMFGIANVPDAEAEKAILAAAANLQVLRRDVGRIDVNSWFRCAALQFAIYKDDIASGETTKAAVLQSQHIKGEAVDVVCYALSRDDFLDRALRLASERKGFDFDQIILYDFGSRSKRRMLHISYTTRRPNRHEVLVSPAAGVYRDARPSLSPRCQEFLAALVKGVVPVVAEAVVEAVSSPTPAPAAEVAHDIADVVAKAADEAIKLPPPLEALDGPVLGKVADAIVDGVEKLVEKAKEKKAAKKKSPKKRDKGGTS